jgi:hypothetical protein
MKTAILYGLVLLLSAQGVGCTSMHVIDKAHGTPPERDDAKPAYYLLLPLSVPIDIALGAFFLYLIAESESDDDCSAFASSTSRDRKRGLKVRRP